MAVVRLFILIFAFSLSLWSLDARAQHEEPEPPETEGVAQVQLPTQVPDPGTRKVERAIMDAAFKAIPKYDYDPEVYKRTEQQIADLGNLLLNTPYAKWTPDQRKLGYVIAHRGFHSEPKAPEHSPASIYAAYLAGSDGVEIDTKITLDGGVVLGHDFTMARETTNWGGQGSTVRWDPIENYPVVDPAYANIAKGNKFPEDDPAIDSLANPKRSGMFYKDVMSATLLDNFGNISPIISTVGERPQTQMSLYQALYFTAVYAPMQIWLDVKKPADFQMSTDILNALRGDLADQPDALNVLKNVFFKLSYGRFKAEYPQGFDKPLNKMFNSKGLGYFFIFQPNDLLDFEKLDPSGDAFAGFQRYCRLEVGCVGAEFSFKYPDAPGQDFMNRLNANQVLQASFHNAPPYLWLWAFQSPTDRVATYGRWYARAESCCADRTDVLAFDKASAAPEIDDLRPSAYFMEQGYNFITTDDAVGVLKDLSDDDRRKFKSITKADTVQNNTPYPDGLYTISSRNVEGYLSGNNAGNVSLLLEWPDNGLPITSNYSLLWYLRNGINGTATLQAAVQGKSYLGRQEGGSIASLMTLDEKTNSGYTPTLIIGSAAAPEGVSGYVATIQMNYTGGFFGYTSARDVSWNGDGRVNSQWMLTPLEFPFPERSTSTLGPRGMQFCAETIPTAGTELAPRYCSTPPGSTVAYGSRQDFILKSVPEKASGVECTKEEFGVSTEADNSIAECFYAPTVDSRNNSPTTFPFYYCAKVGDSCVLDSSVAQYSFAIANDVSSSGDIKFLSYKTLDYVDVEQIATCNPADFDVTPPAGATVCFYAKIASHPNPDFAYCAEQSKICEFSGTAAIAYGSVEKNAFVYRTFRGSAKCSTDNFISDPAPGIAKSCYYMDVSIPTLDRYAYLGKDGDQIVVENTGPNYVIYYGTEEAWYNKLFPTPNNNAPFVCQPATFDGVDPAPGRVKACLGAPAYFDKQGNLLDFIPCVQTCLTNAASVGALGRPQPVSNFAGASIDYAIANGTIQCAIGSGGFNRDPASNIAKACMQARVDLPQQAPPHFTYCAQQGKTCYIKGVQSHTAYGAAGKFTYQWAKNDNFLCDVSSFNGVDPNVGVVKGCYVYVND